MSSEDKANQAVVAYAGDQPFTFEHNNSLEPDAPQGVTLENCGNHMFRVNIATPPSIDYDGYQVSIFESTADGLVPTDLVGLTFIKDEEGTMPEIVVGGTLLTTDGVPFGLTGGKDYVAKVAAFHLSDNGTPDNESDDLFIFSAEAVSMVEALRVATPPTISFVPAPGTYTNLTKTIKTGEHTAETFSVPTFATKDVSFVLQANTPVSGYWSINGGLTLDLLNPSSSGIHDVSNVSTISISEHLADGEHSISFTGTNAQGDSVIFSQVFAVDTTPPKLLLSSPVNGSFFGANGSLNVEGFGDSDTRYTIRVDGVDIVVNQTFATDTTGAFTYDLWVDPGVSSHHVSILATDAVGNTVTQSASVKNKGLASLTDVGLMMNGSVFTNKNLMLNPTSSTTAQLHLVGTGSGGTSFVIDDSRMVSWSVLATEGSASIDQDGLLSISPGSVGFAQGSLQVLDTFSLTATMTFGAEVYSTEQYHLVLTSTVGGTVSGIEGQYLAGAPIALSSTPSPGYRFDGWSSSQGGSFADASLAATVFTMPASNTVITARFTHVTSTPKYPPQPIAGGSRIAIFANKLQLISLPIQSERVTLPNGSVVDRITLATSLAPTIQSKKDLGATHATIQLELKAAQSAAGVTISAGVLQALAGMDLTILTPHASLTLPAALVNSLGKLGQPFSIVMEPQSLDDLAGLIPAGTDALDSTVLSVQTDLRGLTKVTMPVNIELPTSEQERQAILDELMVFILHSDNSRQTIHDVELNIDPLTKVLKSMSFWVDNFSSFAVVKPNYQALSTTVGQSGFSLNGVTRDMVACYYKGNDTMMPIRLLEDFGVNLAWDEATKTATMNYKSSSVTLTIGSTYATINGVVTPIIGASGLAVAPELAPGRTMIPLRFVSEHLGFTVSWDPSHLVTIRLNK